MVQFQLFSLSAPIPSGYRLATTQDVENNKQGLLKAMPGWEIANLANGSVDGASYGGNVRGDIRNDVGHKLAVSDPNCVSQPSTFQLLNINDSLPQGYRLATLQDVQANPRALRAAMPGWEIANLANGSVDGASYGCNIRYETRNDVSHKLATCGKASSPLKFQLIGVADELPPYYRLATRYEVESKKEALFEAMPKWEIANLADGSVEGALYGGRTSTTKRTDVGHKLAVPGNTAGPSKFQLFNVADELPPYYRLATKLEVESNKEALSQAMPGWEIANLADGSVDGALYGGRISTTKRTDVGHKLAVLGNTAGPSKFELFGVADELPPYYRLATRYEVESKKQALFEAMPKWEIANLADGSVDGALYGGRTSTTKRTDVGHKLAVLGNAAGPSKFQLFNVADELPPYYRLATKLEVESNKEALFQAMPGGEIANLADGSVEGALYGGRICTTKRTDVGHKLAVQGV